MWGYQPHFRSGQELQAKRLFQTLDARFDPQVFLVGILAEDRADRCPACVEPENNFWVESEAFDGVLERAHEIIPTDPESEVWNSHPLAQQWHEERLLKRSIIKATEEVIEACAGRPDGMTYSISWPIMLDGFFVMLVIGLQDAALNSHPRLKIDELALHAYRRFKVPVSLIDAVLSEYLADAAEELSKPDPGQDMLSGRSSNEILRAAGQRMMTGVAQRVDSWDNQQGREKGLFDACNQIAATKYEQATSTGTLLLARKDHPAVCREVVFKTPVNVHRRRAARKLLELTDEKIALHLNAKDAWGLATVEGYGGDSEDLFEVRITDLHRWELVHDCAVLMRVCDWLPCLPKPSIDVQKLRVDLLRIFQRLGGEDADRLIDLVESAENERHGTMLVISTEAEAEAERLASQATCLEPCTLTPDILSRLTPIDGAVLLDLSGVCHAIGAILDGLADKGGDPARGARYNSALRYVATRDEACMAIVVSEDGGVDIVPDLLPPIRRADIEAMASDLEVIQSEPTLDRQRFVKLVSWLETHAFYLLPDDCRRINESIAKIDERIATDDPDGLHIVRSPFKPNPALEPSFYYEEELQKTRQQNMPTLNWIGKEAVVNHHREVPYHLLRCDEKLSVGDPGSGNLLVQGDNLLALKALLPYYADQVKCIYIDPPYNTGDENWVYNDNVNSPDIGKWLGSVVGKEAEDLSRHDKWLCMMYPRLALLREFLRSDGVIFISIDEHEVGHLRLMMGDIFGNTNALGTLVWKRRSSSAMRGTPLSIDHEYVLAYAHDAPSATMFGLSKGVEGYPHEDERGR